MTVTVNASGHAQANNPATSVSANVTTTVSNTLLVAIVKTGAWTGVASGQNTVTAFSGGGLTWKRLFTKSDNQNGRHLFFTYWDVWVATAASAGTYSPSATLSFAVPSGMAAVMDLFAVAGVPDLNNPFDPNFPFIYNSAASGSTATANVSTPISTASSNGLMLGAQWSYGGGSTVNTGSGVTNVEHGTTNVISNAGYEAYSASGSQSFLWTGTDFEWSTLVICVAGTTAAQVGMDHSNYLEVGGSGSTGATSVSNTSFVFGADRILVAMVATHDFTSFNPSTVTDSSGLTWNLFSRKETTLSGRSTFLVTNEIWWAHAPSSGEVTVTATFNHATPTSPSDLGATLSVIPFSGANLTTPIDVTSQAYNTYASGTTPSSVTSAAISTSSTAGILIGFEQDEEGGINVGTGVTSLAHSSVLVIQNGNVGYKPYSAGGSQTFPWTGSAHEWTTNVFAVTSQATSTGVSGTITTSLTKANLSANGSVYKATIAQPLSGISQTAQGVSYVPPVGTIHTSLSGVSQSASGALATTKGTINSTLSKISQLAQGTLNIGGTITTRLRLVTLEAGGWSTVEGGIAMQLGPVEVSAHAEEIFTGTITTNLNSGNGIATGIVGTEIFVGTIVTNLDGFSFAVRQQAEGLEEILGTITTRLGNANGQGIGNVVEAELIISGPIVMSLPGFTVSLLGMQLGQPGKGAWQTWRYTDS